MDAGDRDAVPSNSRRRGGFVANIAGVEAPSGDFCAAIALAILIGGTINLVGRGALKVFMTASIVAEVIGRSACTWLLLFHRQNFVVGVVLTAVVVLRTPGRT